MEWSSDTSCNVANIQLSDPDPGLGEDDSRNNSTKDQKVGVDDSTADYNDGSCIAAVYGCMDSSACNYNSDANVGNGCHRCIPGMGSMTTPKPIKNNSKIYHI